jgi:cell division protein FtsB
MDDKELYKQKARAKLDEVNARIDVLKAQASNSSADAQLKANKELEKLRSGRDDLKARMDKLQDDSADAWDELRTGLDRAMADIHAAMENAGRELRGER